VRVGVCALSACLVALAVSPRPAGAKTVRRFGLFVGNDAGHGSEVPLRWAEADARRLRDTFLDVGGFHPEDTVLLEGAGPADVVRAAEDLAGRVRVVEAAGRQTLMLVYYSGHADARALHLGSADLEMARLHAALEGSGAQVRLAVVDACRSGGFSRLKGGRVVPPFAIRVEEGLFGEGHVTLTSSAADEDSQESDRLRGSYFTHHVVAGLRGAADRSGDGRVTLSELYRYAYHQTVRSTRATAAGAQHPAYRFDLRGHADLVLATLPAAGGRLARLRFEHGGSWLVMDEESGDVAAEVAAGTDGGVLVLPAGTYRVSRRERDALLETVVELSAGAEAPVREAALERFAYARLVRKGGHEVAVAAHGVLAGGGAQTSLSGLAGPMPLVQAGYVLDLRWLSVRALLSLGRASGTTPALTYDLRQAGAGLQVLHVVDLWRLSLAAGLSTGVTHFTQRLSGGEGERTALGVGFGGVISAGVDLGAGLSLSVTGEVGTRTFPLSDAELGPVGSGELASLLAGRGWAAVGYTF